MSATASLPLLDVRNLTPAADATRVTEWARTHPTGRLWIGDASTGTQAHTPSWYQRTQRGNGELFRAHAQRAGTSTRAVVGVRLDVLAPASTAFCAPADGWAAHVARSPGHPWREALAVFTAAGYLWSWPSGFGAGFTSQLPADALVYISSPTLSAGTKTFTMGGVGLDMNSPDACAWAVDRVAEIAEFWQADVLVGIKPWERNDLERISPASQVHAWGWTGGYCQPTPFTSPLWEVAVASMLPMLRAALPESSELLTLTRPPTPSLVKCIGYGTACEAVTAEAALTQWVTP